MRACCVEPFAILQRPLKFSIGKPMPRRGFILRRALFMTNRACAVFGFLAIFISVWRFEGTRVPDKKIKTDERQLGSCG